MPRSFTTSTICGFSLTALALIATSASAQATTSSPATPTPSTKTGDGLTIQGRFPPPTLGNFFAMDFHVDAQMAPSKPILAVVKNVSGDATIELYDFTETRPKKLAGLDLPFELYSITWKTDSLLLLSGRDTQNRATVWSWTIGQARPTKLFGFATWNDDYNPRPSPITDQEYKDRSAESLARSRDDNAPRAYLESEALSLPDEVILNIRNGERNQLEAISLTTLARRIIDVGSPNKNADWFIGPDATPTLRIEQAPRQSTQELFLPARANKPTQLIRTLPFEDHFSFSIMGPSDRAGYLTVRARKDDEEFASLYQWNPATNSYGDKLMAGDGRDILDASFMRSGKLAGAVDQTTRFRTRATSSDDAARIAEIEAKIPADTSLTLISWGTNDNIWTVRATGPTQSGALWFHDRRTKRLVRIGPVATSLDNDRLGPSNWLEYAGRDGTKLQALVSMPPASYGQAKLPTVIIPHGGPHGILATYDWDPMAAYFSSRGYVVVQPNFRGSSGYGRSFQRAGYRQWGGTMQNDVTDAVRAIIADGRADPAKIAILGGSYGGYSALAGATSTPELYRCAVSLNGVADLQTQMQFNKEKAPNDTLRFWTSTMGDPATDAPAMAAASPARSAARAQSPILILAGGEDERVGPDNSRQMFDALARAGKVARFVELPKMRHSPASWRETTIVYAEMEYFLQGCLENVTTNPVAPADRVEKDEKLIIKSSPAAASPRR